MLQISDLEKSFDGGPPIFSGVTCRIDAGQAVALTGESGSGKSTILHLAAGLDTPSRGTVLIEGVDIAALDEAGRADLRRDRIGLVFQQFNLIPSLTVGANIAFQARIADRHDPAWAQALSRRLGLEGLSARYPEELSGGQQQRVAIGRALAARPRLILADEPTGNLDEATGDAVMSLLLDLVAETGAALLVVTHSERLADRMDRKLRLSRGTLQ